MDATLEKILFGLAAIMAVGFYSWQTEAILRNGLDGGNDVRAMITLYETEPEETETLINLAVRECLQKKANGELPEYFIEFLSHVSVKTVEMLADEDITSATDARIKQMKADFRQEMQDEAAQVEVQLKEASSEDRRRMNKIMDWVQHNKKAQALCVGTKVMKMANND